jgi:hypothetical protein
MALAAPLTPTTVFVSGSSFAGQQKLTANRLMVTGLSSGILNSRVSSSGSFAFAIASATFRP